MSNTRTYAHARRGACHRKAEPRSEKAHRHHGDESEPGLEQVEAGLGYVEVTAATWCLFFAPCQWRFMGKAAKGAGKAAAKAAKKAKQEKVGKQADGTR